MADRARTISYATRTGTGRRSIRPLILWAVIGLICLGGGIALWVSRPMGREEPARVISASNVHQIGLGILLFQNDHAGHYPDTMAEIVSMGITPRAPVSPFSNDTPGQWNKPTTRQAAAILATPGHCSYVYLGHASWTDATIPADAIVAYDPPANSQGAGSNMLFGDGHADWIPNPRADRLIKAASATTQPVSAARVP